jgi:hypothetical protein
MRFMWLGGLAFCAIFLGCDQTALMNILVKKHTPPEAESTARYYVDLLRQGKFDQIKRDLDPSVVDPNLRDKLAQMAALFPAENPQSVKVVGFDLSNGQGYSKTKITLEYQFPSKWLLVSFATQNTRSMSGIVDFLVIPTADSLENIHKFTLVGKSVVQYSILMLAVCSAVFSFYVLIQCIRTKDLRMKWLWMLVVLVGVEKVAVNWETGQLTFGILAIYIPDFIVTRVPYGPYTVGVCIPLGAILFLRWQRKLKIASESIPPLVQSAK